MSEIDVEATLREIRAAVHARLDEAALNKTPGSEFEDQPTSLDTEFAAAMIRLEANLATAARAADRLPPVSSNRTGVLARFELWFKRQARVAMRWFTWEQTNFNASVRDSISEVALIVRGLSERQEGSSLQVDELDAKLESQTHTLRVESTGLRANHSELETRLASLESKFASDVEELRKLVLDITSGLRTSIETTQSELNDIVLARVEDNEHSVAWLRSELQRIEQESRYPTEIRNLIDQFVAEQRERLLQHDDEMRVLFKQLSLEASEQAVLVDRIKRALDSKIDDLAARFSQAEGKRAPAASLAAKQGESDSATVGRKN